MYKPGARFYSCGLGRWLSRDPIEERGGLNIYLAMSNRCLLQVDPDGRRDIPFVKHAIGLAANASIVAKLNLEGPGIVAGAGAAYMFFPASCEVARFSVMAGFGRHLADWRRPKLEDFPSVSDWLNFEAGFYAGFGVGIEVAMFVGSGVASANTFNGIFHTAQASSPTGWGAALYVGAPLSDTDSRMWVGGSISVGEGFGLAKIDWDYQHNGSVIDLDGGGGFRGFLGRCECKQARIIIGLIPEPIAQWYF